MHSHHHTFTPPLFLIPFNRVITITQLHITQLCNQHESKTKLREQIKLVHLSPNIIITSPTQNQYFCNDSQTNEEDLAHSAYSV